MKRFLILLFAAFSACSMPVSRKATPVSNLPIPETTINQLIDTLKLNMGITNINRLEKGVKHAASLWRTEDGSTADFKAFCKTKLHRK